MFQIKIQYIKSLYIFSTYIPADEKTIGFQYIQFETNIAKKPEDFQELVFALPLDSINYDVNKYVIYYINPIGNKKSYSIISENVDDKLYDYHIYFYRLVLIQEGNKKYIRKKINLTIAFTIILGLLITIPMTIYPNFFLNFLYKTTEGANYTRLLAPICLLEYIQSPISFSIEAIGKSKINFYASIISVASRTIILIILSNFKLGIYSFIISLSINIILTTLYSYIKLNKYLK